ncbi:MAG: efflux transporter outer membrane subunit [Bdellovibrionales bacterium]|nr:efflux transporter outer membrane subunit [Bdellovibrionales bacterium]
MLLSVCLVSACSPYSPRLDRSALEKVPSDYRAEKFVAADAPREQIHQRWWEAFGDARLNSLVEEALQSNRSLQAAWSRLAQVREAAVIAGSTQYPQIDAGGGATRNKIDDDALRLQDGTTIPSKQYYNRFVVQSGLSFEADIWKRIASQKTAAEFEAEAVQADVEQTALLLSGTVVELWFRAKELQSLLDVLNDQIQVGSTLLELTELRFAVGKGTALAVLQQRQQLAATKSELPRVQRNLEEVRSQLAVLIGKPPSAAVELEVIEGTLPDLPPLPEFVSPLDLLEARPDLRAAQSRMSGAEYSIASALADRFPRLTLGLSYEFSAAEFSDAFTREAGSIAANLLVPLVDGGRRRAEVRRQTARAEELWHSFADTYLNALGDVEASIAREYWQGKLLERLSSQFKLSQATLRESKSRYINGLTDYVDVIVAVQASQEVERRVLTETRELLVTRARLYRALGGRWHKNTVTPDGFNPRENNQSKVS